MSHHKGLLGNIVWLLASLSALELGVFYFRGWSLINYLLQFLPANYVPQAAAVVYGLIAVAGVLSLVFWVMCLFHPHD